MDNEYRWPKKGDDPFLIKPTSRLSPTWASLHWMENMRVNDSLLASAFKECGDKIIDELDKTNNRRHADIYFFPIGYLYRHALELKMKQIIRLALNMDLLKENKKIREVLDGHALYPLWNYVKRSAKKFWPDSTGHELETVERVIQALHNMDKTGQRLRYTKSTDGKSTFSSLPESVDLLQFRDVFAGVFNLLDGCEEGFSEAFQAMCEMAQDYGP